MRTSHLYKGNWAREKENNCMHLFLFYNIFIVPFVWLEIGPKIITWSIWAIFVSFGPQNEIAYILISLICLVCNLNEFSTSSSASEILVNVVWNNWNCFIESQHSAVVFDKTQVEFFWFVKFRGMSVYCSMKVYV